MRFSPNDQLNKSSIILTSFLLPVYERKNPDNFYRNK